MWLRYCAHAEVVGCSRTAELDLLHMSMPWGCACQQQEGAGIRPCMLLVIMCMGSNTVPTCNACVLTWLLPG
jgi:hypothetical protein